VGGAAIAGPRTIPELFFLRHGEWSSMAGRERRDTSCALWIVFRPTPSSSPNFLMLKIAPYIYNAHNIIYIIPSHTPSPPTCFYLRLIEK
jgi:hypothetical protein